MADKGQTEQKAAEEKPKKKSKLPIIIGFVVLVLLNVIVVGKVMLGGKGEAHKKEKEKVEEEIGAKVGLDEFLVNLSGSDGHYLKTTIAVGVAKGLTEEKIKEENAPIRDAIISVLCSKKLEQLSSEEGKEKLKEEIKARVNKELGDDKIVKIYYTEFATQ
jgi:flagellar FliL protein